MPTLFKTFSVIVLILSLYKFSSSSSSDHLNFQHHAIENCSYYDSVFQADTTNGWGLLTDAYVVKSEDSVELELILSRNIPDSNNWAMPSLVGKIDSLYAPSIGRSLEYHEPNRTWEIVVQPDGNFYLKLLGGPDPLGSPMVLPIKTKYQL